MTESTTSISCEILATSDKPETIIDRDYFGKLLATQDNTGIQIYILLREITDISIVGNLRHSVIKLQKHLDPQTIIGGCNISWKEKSNELKLTGSSHVYGPIKEPEQIIQTTIKHMQDICEHITNQQAYPFTITNNLDS